MERVERSERMSALTKFVIAISIIGALNWGLVGFFNWNLVDAIFGGGAREQTSGWARVIYAIVGLCGLTLAFLLPRLREYELPSARRTGSTRTDVHA